MTTLDMECPKCGAPGSLPKNKVNSRLVCKKCRAIFYVTPSGRAVLGEPPMSEVAREEVKTPRLRDSERVQYTFLPSIPIKTEILVPVVLLAGLLTLIGWAGYSILTWLGGPTDDMMSRAQVAADAIGTDNIGLFQSTCLMGTEPDCNRFFETARASLSPVRAKSVTKSVNGKVFLLEVSEKDSRGQVLVLFTPQKGSTRDQQIAEVESTEDPKKSATAEFLLEFGKDTKGKWRVDPVRCLDRTIRSTR